MSGVITTRMVSSDGSMGSQRHDQTPCSALRPFGFCKQAQTLANPLTLLLLGLHLAGKNRSQAQWTADRWSEAGFNTRLDTYNVFLDYPINKSMSLTYPNGSVYQPSLEEDVLPEDPTTEYPNRTPTFHGYSFSGAASGQLVYVGLGQQADFERLRMPCHS